jgi:biofilm protein TabA
MIVGKLEVLADQVPASSRLQKALIYLKEAGVQNLPDGRHEIDGSVLYALVQSYETTPVDEHSKFEAHRKYIDVQYIADGIEIIGWAPLAAMAVTKEYSEEKDIAFGTCPLAVSTQVKVAAGQAAIFFPEDAHAPKLAVGTPAAVKKIVVKVAV